MMKKQLVLLLGIGMFFVGCNNQPQIKALPKTKDEKIIKDFVKDFNVSKPIKQIAKHLDKPINVKEVKKQLLQKSVYYAEKHKKEAIKETIRLQPNIPLYQKPIFAEMYVMPYVSNDGIYHDTQKVFIKIKKGKFVLNTKSSKYKNQRVFSFEGLNNEY